MNEIVAGRFAKAGMLAISLVFALVAMAAASTMVTPWQAQAAEPEPAAADGAANGAAKARAADEGIYAIFYQNSDGQSYTLVIQNGNALDPAYPKPSADQVVLIEGEDADGRGGYSQYREYTTHAVVKAGVKPRSLQSWFSGFVKLKDVDLAGLDASQTKSMNSMFSGCSSLKSLDLSKLDTAKVADVSNMLSGCSSLESVDLAGVKLPLVKDKSGIFSDCWALQKVTLGDGEDWSGVLPGDIRGGQHGGYRGTLVTQRWIDKATGEKYRSEDIPTRKAAVYELERTHCPIPISDCEIHFVTSTPTNTWSYTGQPIQPKLSVSLGGCAQCHTNHPVVREKLEEGTHYTVSYLDNILPGQATATITGKGRYQGMTSRVFFIAGTAASQPGADGTGSGSGDNSGGNDSNGSGSGNGSDGASGGSGNGSGNSNSGTGGGNNGGDSGGGGKLPVVFSEAVTLPLDASGVTMDKDDVARDLQKRFGSRADFPKDAARVDVAIKRDGKEVEAIDPRKAGTYAVRATYTMADGTQRVIETTYAVADPTVKKTSTDAGKKADDKKTEATKTAATSKKSAMDKAKTGSPLAQTGDAVPLVPLATFAGAAAVLVFAALFRRRTWVND